MELTQLLFGGATAAFALFAASGCVTLFFAVRRHLASLREGLLARRQEVWAVQARLEAVERAARAGKSLDPIAFQPVVRPPKKRSPTSAESAFLSAVRGYLSENTTDHSIPCGPEGRL